MSRSRFFSASNADLLCNISIGISGLGILFLPTCLGCAGCAQRAAMCGYSVSISSAVWSNQLSVAPTLYNTILKGFSVNQVSQTVCSDSSLYSITATSLIRLTNAGHAGKPFSQRLGEVIFLRYFSISRPLIVFSWIS